MVMVKSMLPFHLLEKTLLSPQAPAELKGGYRAHGWASHQRSVLGRAPETRGQKWGREEVLE